MSVSLREALAAHGIGIPDEGEWQIRCPFHKGGEERSPSARAYNETQSVYCWVCAKSWTAIDIWAAARGMTFAEASRALGLTPQASVKVRTLTEQRRFAETVRALKSRIGREKAFSVAAAMAARAVNHRLTDEAYEFVSASYLHESTDDS